MYIVIFFENGAYFDEHTRYFTSWSAAFDYCQKLNLELAGIKEIDMSMFNFETNNEEVDPEEVIEDEPPEEIEAIAEYGMIFELGDHRLMCGDSTSTEDMESLMAGEKPKMVFTDPPYGVSIGDKNKDLTDNGYGGVLPRT